MKQLGYLIKNTDKFCTIFVPYYKYIRKYKKLLLRSKKYKIKDYRRESKLGDIVCYDTNKLTLIKLYTK